MPFFSAVIALALFLLALLLKPPIGVSFNCCGSRPLYLVWMAWFPFVSFEPMFRVLASFFFCSTPEIIVQLTGRVDQGSPILWEWPQCHCILDPWVQPLVELGHLCPSVPRNPGGVLCEPG